MKTRRIALLTSALGAFAAGSVWAADPPTQTGAAPSVRLGTGTDQPATLPGIDVVSQKLDQARSQLEPSLGATSYTFSRAIDTLPQGDNSPLNATLP